ncbi:hypothetical protein [[Haemophilus] ducreyi]|nr:hypothetical protein [[Haemophilus] ducreyi]SEV96391.1 hypothetical protein SAMN02983000_0903 [[Haemophilus] ducreyi]VEG83601.1 Uncharacterised protein [[Haemophilus] ducreyi]
MKRLVLLVVSMLVISACSQSKDIYFNGAKESHSGLKYEPGSKTLSVN